MKPKSQVHFASIVLKRDFMGGIHDVLFLRIKVMSRGAGEDFQMWIINSSPAPLLFGLL
jgi:hypothetical protein